MRRFLKLKAAPTSQRRRYPASYERLLPLVLTAILIVIIARVFPAAR